MQKKRTRTETNERIEEWNWNEGETIVEYHCDGAISTAIQVLVQVEFDFVLTNSHLSMNTLP